MRLFALGCIWVLAVWAAAPLVAAPAKAGKKSLKVEADSNTVTASKDGAARMPEVLVTGEVLQSASKLGLPVRDSVQTVDVVPGALLKDRNVSTVRQAMDTVIGVQTLAGYGGMEMASIITRGFDNDWVLRDGFRYFKFGVSVETAGLERLEVLKGPAALQAGQTDPGGTLNLVLKKPVKDWLFDLETTVGSYGFSRSVLDVGGALPDTQDALQTRLSVAHEASASHRDNVEKEKIYVAPQFSWRLGPEVELQAAFDYIHDEHDFERGLPSNPLSLQVPVSRTLNDPRLPKSRYDSFSIFQSLTWGMGGGWKLRQAVGAVWTKNLSLETYLGSPDASGNIDLWLDRGDEENGSFTAQLELHGAWDFAGSPQKTVVGLEYSDYRFWYVFYDENGMDTPEGSVNLFDPQFTYALPDLDTPAFSGEYGSQAFSVYLDHQAVLFEGAKLLGGGRFDVTKGYYEDPLTGTPNYEPKTDQAFSPRVGLVVTPLAPMDLFASFATSFKPNVFGTDASGDIYDPETGEQVEAGIRYEFIPGKLRGYAAAYRVTKRNVVVYEPPVYTASNIGTRRSEGIELELSGSPLEGWDLTAGYGHGRAWILEDSDPSLVGLSMLGVPRDQASLWNKFEIKDGALEGLSFGYGLFFVGERPTDVPSSLDLPANVRHDLMVGFKRGDVRLQVNLENLTSERIYDPYGWIMYPRPPLNVKGSVGVKL